MTPLSSVIVEAGLVRTRCLFENMHHFYIPTRLTSTCIALGLSTGCAGHSAKTLQARAALDANQPAEARKLLNESLKVKTANDFPVKVRKDDAVFILDRSMVSQQLDDYEASSSDLQYADKAVEMLDISRTAVADIGKFIFSDDSGSYRGAPYEKAMINTMNIVNYLARHDLNGARIEARRLSIMQKYLREKKNPAASINAPGGYLAGFVFEKSGSADVALRYYDEALEYTNFPTLVEPIRRLSALSAYSTPRLKKFLAKHGEIEGVQSASEELPPEQKASPLEGSATPATEELSPTEEVDLAEDGELLVIISYGRVPAKVAKRIPIGLALTYASLFISPGKQATANRLAAQGLVTWINYPDLEEVKRKLSVPRLLIDGKAYGLDGAVAVDIAARKAYEKERGAIIASAITRMITRVVAGEAAGAAARSASNDNVVGALVSLGTQATMTAFDTPDTRSWSTLPARIAVSRIRLSPGLHKISLSAQGITKKLEVKMTPGGWDAVVLTILK